MTNGNNQAKTIELRDVAETSLRHITAQSLKDLEALLPKETLGVLHELRVHQIELEMQNEELRRAQAELAAERRRYVDLYEMAPVGYCAVSQEGLILEANLNATLLLGVSRAALSQQPITQFIHESDQDSYYLLHKQLFETGEPQAPELRMVTNQGVTFWASLRTTVAYDERSTPLSRVVLSDITGRKHAEEELQASQRQLSDIIKFLPTATLAINKEGRVIIWNKAIEIMTGIPAIEMIGKTHHAHAIPFYGEARPQLLDVLLDDRAEVAALYPNMIREGDVVHAEVFCNALYNQRGAWVFAKASPLHDQDGNIIGAIESIRDISERKISETYGEMSREVLAILNEPGELQTAIQSVAIALKTRTGVDAVGIRLQDGKDFPYFAQIGFPENFIGMENTLLSRTAEGELSCDKDGEVKLACTCGLVLSGKTNPASPLFTPGGSFWVNDSEPLLDLLPREELRFQPRNQCIYYGYASFALVPIRKQNKIIGLIHFGDQRKGSFTLNAMELLEGIATNIGTALMRKQAEEENRKLQLQLIQAQKMEAIGTLAGGIAHDFNNILGAMLGYTEMAKDAIASDSEASQDLDKVMQAGLRAAGLVKQILAFSRQADAYYIPLKPSLIVKEALKLLRPSLPSTITIKQSALSSRSILADPTQVHQILMNLCTNSFHAMELTGGTLEISVKDCYLSPHDLLNQPEIQSGMFVELAISDTGPGISPEIRDKIFDPYFTTKEIGKGTGMGLAIAHGIITSYGGFITCESECGKGTIFRVLFPAIEEDVVSVGTSVEVVPTGTERILLVDDEETLAELGKTMLESLGYKVTAQTNSQEALALFRNQPEQFDAVITDQTMPGMTGMDLARQILQIQPKIPIILCTGYSTLSSQEQAKAEGIMDFAMKPLSKKAMATLLRSVLANTTS